MCSLQRLVKMRGILDLIGLNICKDFPPTVLPWHGATKREGKRILTLPSLQGCEEGTLKIPSAKLLLGWAPHSPLYPQMKLG